MFNSAHLVPVAGLTLTAFAAIIIFRKQWPMIDLGVTSILGVMWLVWPELLLGLQVDAKELDAVQIHMSRACGVQMLAFALALFLLRNNKETHRAFAISRLATNAILLVTQAYAHIEMKGSYPRWNEDHVLIGMVGCALQTLGSALFLDASSSAPDEPDSDKKI